MAQEGFDALMTRTDSRYRLAMVAARRAGQLKHGVPSTLTGKPIARADNAVTVALKELEVGSGVRWGDDLPSAEAIGMQVQRDSRESSPPAYSVSHDEAEDDHDRVGVSAGGFLGGARRWLGHSSIGVRERRFTPRSPSRLRHPVDWCGGSMSEVASDSAFWVMWIGPRQWEGLPGEFDVGQPGWVCAAGEPAGGFIFYPILGAESAWSYQVACVARDFLRYGTLERV